MEKRRVSSFFLFVCVSRPLVGRHRCNFLDRALHATGNEKLRAAHLAPSRRSVKQLIQGVSVHAIIYVGSEVSSSSADEKKTRGSIGDAWPTLYRMLFALAGLTSAHLTRGLVCAVIKLRARCVWWLPPIDPFVLEMALSAARRTLPQRKRRISSAAVRSAVGNATGFSLTHCSLHAAKSGAVD